MNIETLIKLFDNGQQKTYLSDHATHTHERETDMADINELINPKLDFVEQIRDWSNSKLCDFILMMDTKKDAPSNCVDWGYSEVRALYANENPQTMDREEVMIACNILCAMRNITPLYDAGC